MGWAKLLADNRVTRVPPSKAELDDLRSIMARNGELRDRPRAWNSLYIASFNLPATIALTYFGATASGRGEGFGLLLLVAMLVFWCVSFTGMASASRSLFEGTLRQVAFLGLLLNVAEALLPYLLLR